MTSLRHVHRGVSHRQPPAFFAEVQRRSRARWNQLEADPELAGPWKQLFAQVQSPRHVLSELLQNADDVGAKRAAARIENGVFIFEHDGADFDQEQFESLCRFGFSNKRRLHTIGFRGIGFKSTFSLGPVVEVTTPSLAFRFEKQRFTEPVWIDRAADAASTVIRVRIEDRNREDELRKNLEEWAESPVSLLFFNSIRHLRIQDQLIERRVTGPGPVPDSELVELTGKDTHRLLIVRSDEEAFPEDSIEEIRQERLADEITLPPCRIELVLGLPDEQRLYVVLPTDMRPGLPFSCNAPFVQDPARMGIKDPAVSPTNRWLLGRLGELAAKAMLTWLRNDGLPAAERARAYDLLPGPAEESDNVTGDCENLVKEKFAAAIASQDVLLAEDGVIVEPKAALAPPRDLYAVWDAAQLSAMLGTPGQPVLAQAVSEQQREKLEAWEWLEVEDSRDVLLSALGHGRTPPKPRTWPQTAALWAFVEDVFRNDWDRSIRRRLSIVPAEGSDTLVSSDVAVRLAKDRGALSDADWQFIAGRLKVLDRDWIAYLFPQQAGIGVRGPQRSSAVEASREMVEVLGLDRPTSADTLVLRAYEDLLRQKTVKLDHLVRFVHIIAALDAHVPEGFRYATRDRTIRKVQHGIAADPDGILETLLPERYAEEHLLHPDYGTNFRSCSAQRWREWVSSGKSGLRAFLGIKQESDVLYSKRRLREFLASRQCEMPSQLPKQREEFRVEDFDFDPELLEHWTELSKSDRTLWVRIVQLLAAEVSESWLGKMNASVVQRGYTHEYDIDCGTVPARWLMRLRGLPCITDTHGIPHEPAELLLRTPQTESLLDVEPFVQAELDTPQTRPLLKLLGVRDTPTGPERLIERLRALARVEPTPVGEVLKWYNRLDQLLSRCDAIKIAETRKIFAAEALILTEGGEWVTSQEVFQKADDEDVPGAPLIQPAVREYPLWGRLGVAERPTADRLIAWLKELQSGAKVEGQQLKRVRAALHRIPVRIWQETGHWLSLDGSWTPTEALDLRLTMQLMTKWSDLFPAVKARTANLQMLAAETCAQQPFASVRELGSAIEYRRDAIETGATKSVQKPWIVVLASRLRYVRFMDENETLRVRAAAVRLTDTQWQPVGFLSVVPYIDGTPAGPAHSVDAHWDGRTLYVREGKTAVQFRAVVDELGRQFGSVAVMEAIKACFERDPAFVSEYLDESFEFEEELLKEPEAVGVTQQPSEPRTGVNDDEEVQEENPRSENDDTEQEVEGSGGTNDDENVRREIRRQARSPTLMDRYARARGYRWDEARKRYTHQDRTWIQRCEGSFNWEKCAPDGEVQCRYWTSDRSLFGDGVEIPADVWELVKSRSATAALILRNAKGEPEEYSGAILMRMAKEGHLNLFPAKYRLRMGDA